MDEDNFLRITTNDITEANQLSTQCPICAGPVERYPENPDLTPVGCGECETMYHRLCWQNSGGQCAVLGCNHTTCQPIGEVAGDILTLNSSDMFSDAQLDRLRRRQLKAAERINPVTPRVPQRPQTQSRGFWSTLFARIARAFNAN